MTKWESKHTLLALWQYNYSKINLNLLILFKIKVLVVVRNKNRGKLNKQGKCWIVLPWMIVRTGRRTTFEAHPCPRGDSFFIATSPAGHLLISWCAMLIGHLLLSRTLSVRAGRLLPASVEDYLKPCGTLFREVVICGDQGGGLCHWPHWRESQLHCLLAICLRQVI